MSDYSHTILVVDPDERSYKTFETLLGVKNRVLFVPNGKTAIDLPTVQDVDVVFISQVLNGTDGIVLLESFKSRFPSIPVILIAEQPEVAEVLTAFRSGARDLILKPFEENELTAITEKLFGLVSNNKSKRRRFFAIKRKSQSSTTTRCQEIKANRLRKKFRKNKKDEHSFRKKLNDELIANSDIDSEQLDNGITRFRRIKKSNQYIDAFFFGNFKVFINDKPIKSWPSKKGKSIFAYLLLNHKKKIFRDVLMDIFWQKSCPDSARNCLNVTIHGLRRVLQGLDPKREYILFRDECYYINPEILIKLDVEEFRKTWRYAQRVAHDKGISVAISEFERAAELYKGDFLEDEIYDNWSSLDREDLKETFLVILDKICQNFMHSNNHRDAIGICKKILEKDNCREDIYRRLMECYYFTGHRTKAVKIFRKCTKILKAELEVEPTLTTIELYRKIIKT